MPNETIGKVVKYFEFAQNKESGGFTYAPNGKASVSLACTAGGSYCAQLAGQRDSEMVKTSLRYLKKESPAIFSKAGTHYFYTHYYAIQTMVQAGDEYYAKWYPQIRVALIIILTTPHRYIPICQR